MAYIGITSSFESEQLSSNYIGFPPTVQRPESAFVVDKFTGTGVQTVFPLSSPKPITSRALIVSVAGYTTVPEDDYKLDQYNNIEFTVAPGSGSQIVVHHLIFPRNEATTAIRKLDDIASRFNGTTTRFTLTANGVKANILGANVLVISVNGVIQEPGEAYILDGDDIIFSEAPPVRSSFYGIDVGTTGIGTPGDATISPIKFLTTNLPSQGQVLSVNTDGSLIWATLSGSTGAVNLNGLADVTVTSPTFNNVLKFTGTHFINAMLSYNELVDLPALATIATSGSYTDLLNTPSIPADASELTDTTHRFFDRNYNSLSNKPVIPAELNELNDISIIDPTVYDIMLFDGVHWINDKLTMEDLGIIDGSAGQVLSTDGNGNYHFKDEAVFTLSQLVNGTKTASLDGQGNWSIPGEHLYLVDEDHRIEVNGNHFNFINSSVNGKISLTVRNSGQWLSWELNQNGSITFPDQTVQSTAWQGQSSLSLTADEISGLADIATSGSYNDLTDIPTATSTSEIVNSGTYLTLGNLKVRVPTTGNRSIQLASVAGSFFVSGTCLSDGSKVANLRIDTTPVYLNSAHDFIYTGDAYVWNIASFTERISWRITVITGAGINDNMISIERLL
jgi:hypothetical protein